MIEAFQEDSVVDTVKAFADITLHDPVVARVVDYSFHAFQCHCCIPHRTETVRVREELCFQNWFQNNPHTLLYDPVPNCWDTQWTLFGLTWLINVLPPYLLGLKMCKSLLDIPDDPLI